MQLVATRPTMFYSIPHSRRFCASPAFASLGRLPAAARRRRLGSTPSLEPSAAACEPRAPGERGHQSMKGVYQEAFQQFNEKRSRDLDAQKFTCGKCHQEQSRDGFWLRDLHHRNSRALWCKACRPTPPEERKPAAASRQYRCTACKVDRAREDYWPQDLAHSKLVCKVCRPAPPGQRQRGCKARCSSAGPYV